MDRVLRGDSYGEDERVLAFEAGLASELISQHDLQRLPRPSRIAQLPALFGLFSLELVDHALFKMMAQG